MKYTLLLIAFLIYGLFAVRAFPSTSPFVDMGVIAQIESSCNPHAHNTRTNARGMYQITKICLDDYNLYHVEKLTHDDMFNEHNCYKVADWYINKRIPQLLGHYGIQDTIENRIVCYNAGIRYALNGNIPKETKEYINKYFRRIK